jgi:hypothetical protein
MCLRQARTWFSAASDIGEASEVRSNKPAVTKELVWSAGRFTCHFVATEVSMMAVSCVYTDESRYS